MLELSLGNCYLYFDRWDHLKLQLKYDHLRDE